MIEFSRYVLAALLVACTMLAHAGGEEAIVPTRNEAQVTVQLRLYDTPREVVRACKKLGAWASFTEDEVLRAHPAPGCDAFDRETHSCTMHTLRPRYVEDAERMENLGHETMHCFYGAYHQQE